MNRLPTWCAYGFGLMAVLAALPWAGAADAQEVPFTGVVMEDEVTIRSGAGRAYYSVGTLERGDVVVVEEVFHGWNKIKPPDGVYSYVSKAYVNAEGDGQTGVVNRDRAEVKAANVKGPGTLSYRVIKELSRGDEVTIVEEENGWYKIEPIADTYVFLEPGSVRRATNVGGATEPADPAPGQTPSEPDELEDSDEPDGPGDPDASGQAAGPGDEPTEPIEPQAPDDQRDASADERDETATRTPREPDDADAPTDGAQPSDPEPTTRAQAQAQDPTRSDEPRDDAGDGEGAGDEQRTQLTPSDKGGDAPGAEDVQSQTLADVDQRMLPHFQEPLEEQPIDEMIEAYSRFLGDASLSSADRRIVRLRLAALEHNKRVLAAIQRSGDTLDELASIRREQEDRDAGDFDAVGILRASSIYDGTNMPRLYRLVDPTTQRARAYVAPNDTFNAGEVLGELVGVHGSSSFDSQARLTVLEPTRVTVLESEQEGDDAEDTRE